METLTIATLKKQAHDKNMSFAEFLEQARAGFTHECYFCKAGGGYESGTVPPAVCGMPQSNDQGKTVEIYGCCADHVAGWWDGKDWDGRSLEVDLVDRLNVVIFHDRGVGREMRHFIGGQILFLEDADKEMLPESMVHEVEKMIAKGQLAGITSDPSHPDWCLAYISV